MTTATEAYRYGRLRIEHFEREVPTVAVGRAVYFPLRGLCEQLGIAPQKQVERLRADTRIAPYLRTLPIPTIKGLRDAVCVRKQDVSKWLAGLDPSRCSIGERTRKDLEDFQKALFAAADRFIWGDTGDVMPNVLSGQPGVVTGVLHVGHCPGCGMALRLIGNDVGMHLEADV